MLTVMQGTGDDTSIALNEWLDENPVDEHVRVTLGPNGSFFIWDSKHIGWHGIPDGLQKAIQGWLGPTGWIQGPPRIVTLGSKGSYFALSEYGSVAFSIDDDLKPATAAFSKLKDEISRGSFTYADLEVSNDGRKKLFSLGRADVSILPVRKLILLRRHALYIYQEGQDLSR
jgi:hypothetical protein